MNAAWFLFIPLAILAVAWIVRPLLAAQRPETEEERGLGAARELESRHAMVLAALKDLEDDHRADKVDEHDYEQLRTRLTAEAAAILEQQDRLDEERSRPVPRGPRALSAAETDTQA